MNGKSSLSRPLKLGFLASHGGSSMRAIVDAARSGALAAEARLVISNNADSAALAWAGTEGLSTRHISARTEGSPEAADAAIAQALADAGVELVILSGYMRMVGPRVLERYAGRILNIHPALLPRFGGQGMYGRRVHDAVAKAGAPESGATIHLVDEEYDRGPILAQARVALEPGDGADEIEAKVRAIEPGFFVETLIRIAKGDLELP